jgi:hypothetical protein
MLTSATPEYRTLLSVKFAPPIWTASDFKQPLDEDDGKGATSCSICSPRDRQQPQKDIEFGAPEEDMCERCNFLKQVAEQCVKKGILIPWGTRQTISWGIGVSEGKRWMDVKWVTWEGNLGYHGNRFTIFTTLGAYTCVSTP